MKTIAKLLFVAILVLAVLVVGSGTLLATSVVRSGMMTVKVHETGPDGVKHLYIPVPAALIGLSLDMMPVLTGEDIFADMRSNLGDMRPAVAAALTELEDAPDAVLVDVQDAQERVRIVKEGRTLEIQVDGPDGQVEISLPANLLGRIAREIA
jgi:multidrug efflux pump subunit AcrA (membrane-fusion protein)